MQLGLITILNGLKYLEYIEFWVNWVTMEDCSTEKQIFPKSLKYLKIMEYWNFEVEDGNLAIYDTIDSSYMNLSFIDIVSNKILQNLACGMPNLQEVVIHDFDIDLLNVVKFFKSNPQLRKLDTGFKHYNEEIIKTILSSKYLERWNISHEPWGKSNRENWRRIWKINNLPINYSVKYLKINISKRVALTSQLINACKNLETLDLEIYHKIKELDWSRLERRINKLKLLCYYYTPNTIKNIDASRLFNQVHFKLGSSSEEFIDRYNIYKLTNYKVLSLNSEYCVLKLNKTN
ncbi:hypothetical protein CONCODRAFT_12242 [Conidiobolus coronatus NRRL 28638]|uniref:RNI-like protein n=1 Tax=Conidiobolus coronatus (strain ATCC 28846 / CBS 209.66 / NRRL 28638) TaxID=796925 RepID=A0A137NTE5_CONC2|nr:hypothetical protein CONCODRAFT_12242 [Conidiobolus coronatus NRRL 28638]|eukprot:KXN66016.1 hypothetical protein CONCODRAFT_12242 [Conidiobolus coronatus NRRL 28638]